jgi:hypothetical protein
MQENESSGLASDAPQVRQILEDFFDKPEITRLMDQLRLDGDTRERHGSPRPILKEVRLKLNQDIEEFYQANDISKTKVKKQLNESGLNLKTLKLHPNKASLVQELRRDKRLRAKLRDVKSETDSEEDTNWIKKALVYTRRRSAGPEI